ncbi:MAG: LLM class F420-dependent oxidoreductase, partial [Anaerolineales bacterium]
MKIGLQIPNFTWPGGPAGIAGKLSEIARAADGAGFYSLWVMDHFFQIG